MFKTLSHYSTIFLVNKLTSFRKLTVLTVAIISVALANVYFFSAKAAKPLEGTSQSCVLIGPGGRPDAQGPTGTNDDTGMAIFVNSDLIEADITNTLSNTGSSPDTFVITAPIIPDGFIVEASFNAGNQTRLTPLNNGGSVVAENVNPGEWRNLTVHIFPPADFSAGTNFDIVIQATSTSNPGCFNQTIDRVRFEPSDLTISKTHSPSSFVRGKTGSFTLTASNIGSEETKGLVTITDNIPAGLTPTNVSAGTGWNCGIAGQTVTCTTRDSLPVGATYSPININVNVADNAPSSIANTATISVNGDSNPDNNTATDNVNIGSESCVLVGPFEVPGATGPTSNNDDFTLRKLNAGQSLSPVGFVNTLTNTAATPGNFFISAPTIPNGFAVIASIDSGNTFVSLNSGGRLITPTPVNPGEQRNIDVRITLPSGLPVNTDFDVVIQVAADSDPNCFNQTIDRIRLEPKPDPAQPNLSLVKNAKDVNGGVLLPGDVIEYSLTLSNPSQESVTNAFIAEFIPADVTYIANSVQITSGANAGAKTDAIRDDEVDYYPPSPAGTGNGQINIFTGTGTGINKGGTLAPGESTTVAFRVMVNSTVPCNTVINNGADWGGNDFYAAGKSNISSVMVGCLPDLTISKKHNPSEFVRGETGEFTLTAVNPGAAATSEAVIVTDTIPAGLQPVSASGAGWNCGIAGQTVTCMRGDSLAAGAGYPPITVSVNVTTAAPSTVTNIAMVSGGGEANTTNNTATDTVNIVNSPPCTLIGPFAQPAATGLTGNNDDFTLRNVHFQLANGVTTVAGSVGFINTLTNNGGTPGQIIISAANIPPGFTVTASIDSGATFTILNNGGMLITPTPVNPGEQRNLDVRISVPTGLMVNTFYDVEIQASAGNCVNRTIDRIKPDPIPDPNLTLVKGVVDLNGGVVLPGDVLEYSLTLSNPSSKSVSNTFIADYIPSNVTYVANSVRITSGPGSSPDTKTDAIGDDVADYFPPSTGNNGQLNIFTGKGAAINAVASPDRERRGGTLDPGDSTTVSFRVTVNANVSCGSVINNGADWGGDLVYPGGSSNTATVVTCQATTCQTLCFRSAAYFSLNFGTNQIPNGTVLIGGSNSNSKVSTSDRRVKSALDGTMGALNREFVAAQLNLLNGSGIAAANIASILASPIRCYKIDFAEVTVTTSTLSPNSTMFELFQQAEAVAKRDAGRLTRDGCVLTKILNQLNGNSLSSFCHQTAGSIDFGSCQ